jgi:prefoldin subunit 5
MRFDDEDRLDNLEAKMTAAEKAIRDIQTALDALTKAHDAKAKEMEFANEDKDRQFLGIRKARLEPLENDSKAHGDEIKKLSQRLSSVEAQLKKPSK